MKSKLIIICFVALFFGCSKDKNQLPSSYSNKAAGASANDLLSANTYSTLKIEIQYMPGYAPNSGAITHLQNLLNSILNKPGGITFTQAQITSGNKSVYSLAEIEAIEKANRTVYTTNGSIGVYILYTDGGFETDGVIGTAYRNTSCVIHGKTVHNNSGSLGQASRTKLEATVLEHEIGHLLGLVNLGTSMQVNHEDGSHNKHCNNTDCLMYYAAETTDVLGFLLTGSIPLFDTNCVNDLKANGGK